MPPWCVALHVGVGGFPSDRVRLGLEDAMRRACAAAHGALQRTHSAAAACEAAGVVLEDCGWVNAGVGGNIDASRTRRSDACVATTGGCVACTAATQAANPVSEAFSLLHARGRDSSAPVMLAAPPRKRPRPPSNPGFEEPAARKPAKAPRRSPVDDPSFGYPVYSDEPEATGAGSYPTASRDLLAWSHASFKDEAPAFDESTPADCPPDREIEETCAHDGESLLPGDPAERGTGGDVDAFVQSQRDTIGVVVFLGDSGVAASSSGGYHMKPVARVGEAGVPGAGCWAEEGGCCVLSGRGEDAMCEMLAAKLLWTASAAPCNGIASSGLELAVRSFVARRASPCGGLIVRVGHQSDPAGAVPPGLTGVDAASEDPTSDAHADRQDSTPAELSHATGCLIVRVDNQADLAAGPYTAPGHPASDARCRGDDSTPAGDGRVVLQTDPTTTAANCRELPAEQCSQGSSHRPAAGAGLGLVYAEKGRHRPAFFQVDHFYNTQGFGVAHFGSPDLDDAAPVEPSVQFLKRGGLESNQWCSNPVFASFRLF
ncbi:hypothetical protein DIPPA_10813 [Diplonema papillatum]|nr:hypothetical protein DIPPA_10813 [Diplonema papillatum]